MSKRDEIDKIDAEGLCIDSKVNWIIKKVNEIIESLNKELTDE